MKINDKLEFKSVIYGCLDGADSLAVGSLVETHDKLVYLARDDKRLQQMAQGLAFSCPEVELIILPAWDCLPYDRMSPHSAIVSRRIDALASLAHRKQVSGRVRPCIVLTTVNSWLQRLPSEDFFAESSLTLTPGMEIAQDKIADFLTQNGFLRTQSVREYGEFAIRGGIMDIFAATDMDPVRLDFFGDEIDSMRYFEPLSQRSHDNTDSLIVRPAAEYILDDASISRFRQSYLSLFGGKASKDSLYEAVSAGQTLAGIEHWLCLFHESMGSLSDWLTGWHIVCDSDVQAAGMARLSQIDEFYQARAGAVPEGEAPYRPVPPEMMYQTQTALDALEGSALTASLSSFAAPRKSEPDIGARAGQTFSAARSEGGSPSAAAAQAIVADAKDAPVLLTAASQGALERVCGLIAPHLPEAPQLINAASEMKASGVYGTVWSLENGFHTPHMTVITEQDIFGSRISRPQGRRRRAEDFLREVSSLEQGDLVVHVEHGIGRYEGLETISSDGTDHDCLHLSYSGGDRLYLPVENIDMLSRYGQDASDVILDKLGGAGWQARKARIKGRIKEMAEQLIRIAARRAVATAEPLTPPQGVYDEFCARFGHSETDDQLDALEDVLSDFASGTATDRLICGDVGFGKTEIALRAAFVAAMAGYQVALVTPTTLLARQHGKLCEERFADFPVKVATLSRMTTPKQASLIRDGLSDGSVQLVVGTHAVLAKSISFNNLGLLIIDEEQRFGVGQKERLKELRGDVHVLTLSATPIPRTLQLALSGVRQMSIIATPPVDRLAVRTFVGPWDSVVLREAIIRERFRGGQIFVVCPRIADLTRLYDRVTALVPDARILTAHGKMSAVDLDDVMNRFGDGEADILLSTNIVESGIDIPTANTMIIHRADMFGLSQLYQLRGRVGRSKVRAYAYLTTQPGMVLTPQAKRRLEVMQTLDKLGAGFSLASYDMDIRGAGNLLGDEQSGHVREVGVELYQEMLRQAVDLARTQSKKGSDTLGEAGQQDWSPTISLGTNVLIPEAYVPDLSVRLSLYRRIGALSAHDDINQMAAELVDRFGPMPDTVKNLLEIVELKYLCRNANILKIDAGAKGFALSFKDNQFPAPDKLIGWIASQGGRVQLRSDHKLIVKGALAQIAARAKQAHKIVSDIAGLLSPS
jgi:transcription-repair coupling factor (superfamily II helicase)